MKFLHNCLFVLLIILGFASAINSAHGQEDIASGKPAEAADWASLVYGRTNGRAGPDKDFKISWVYHQRYLPVKVLRRASEWSRIEDMDGDVLWMHNSVLGERRTAIIISRQPEPLQQSASPTSRTLARIAPKVIVRVLHCTASRCQVSVKGKQGWVNSNALWGAVY